eukprot:gene1191-706_t
MGVEITAQQSVANWRKAKRMDNTEPEMAPPEGFVVAGRGAGGAADIFLVSIVFKPSFFPLCLYNLASIFFYYYRCSIMVYTHCNNTTSNTDDTNYRRAAPEKVVVVISAAVSLQESPTRETFEKVLVDRRHKHIGANRASRSPPPSDDAVAVPVAVVAATVIHKMRVAVEEADPRQRRAHPTSPGRGERTLPPPAEESAPYLPRRHSRR